MGAVEQRVDTLLHSPLWLPSSHPHLLPSLLPPPTPVLLFLLLHLLSLTHPLPPPPRLFSLRLSHQCITHPSTSTPLRTHVRWPWGRGGACWRVRVEPCLCSLMGEWCSLQPITQMNLFSAFYPPQTFSILVLFKLPWLLKCLLNIFCFFSSFCQSLVPDWKLIFPCNWLISLHSLGILKSFQTSTSLNQTHMSFWCLEDKNIKNRSKVCTAHCTEILMLSYQDKPYYNASVRECCLL